MPGSIDENSFLNILSYSLTHSKNSFSPAAGTVTIAKDSLGMAFLKLPPSISPIRNPCFFAACHIYRFSSLFEFPFSRGISIPECPPFKPDNSSLKALCPSGTFSSVKVTFIFPFVPPAQPTYSSPSSSESILIRISPSRIPAFKPKAPVIPVSSSIVNRPSIGPCCRSSDSRTLIAAATPIPLSAPRVVPSAVTQPSSIKGSIGSVSKSNILSLFF